MRDGRLYARGASDDKGNFWPLLYAACALARDGELPVNVRVVVEGEEEAGSATITEWIRADERGADAAIVFDSGMVDDADARDHGRAARHGDGADRGAHRRPRPALRASTAAASSTRLHVLHHMLAQVVPGPDGVLRDELRAGIAPAAEAERISWERLPPGTQVLSEVGGREAYPGAAAEYYERNGADASLDINEIVGGEPRTLVPAVARGTVSLRLAPGQRASEIAPELERLLREAAPPEARREDELAPRRPVALRARPAGAPARRAGDRARDRHRAGARPLGRLDPRGRRVRGPRDPHHRQRLRRSPTTTSTRPTSRSASRASSSASARRASSCAGSRPWTADRAVCARHAGRNTLGASNRCLFAGNGCSQPKP